MPRRGSVNERQTIVTLAIKGPSTSKPRPWVVVQSDDFAGTDSVVVCPFTHARVRGAPLLRIDVDPSVDNGLRVPSQIQAEKIVTVRRDDLDRRVGRLEDGYMRQLEQAMRRHPRPSSQRSRLEQDDLSSSSCSK